MKEMLLLFTDKVKMYGIAKGITGLGLGAALCGIVWLNLYEPGSLPEVEEDDTLYLKGEDDNV